MNTDLETRLRADMARFTRDIRIPAGLAHKAARHNHRRRIALRAAVASGTAAALIAGAGVAAALSSPAAPPIQTTAYVVQQVDQALAPANLDHLISFSRTAPLGRKPGILVSPSTGLRQTCVGSTALNWGYEGTLKTSIYAPNGRHLWDSRVSWTDDVKQLTEVIYCNRTWWTVSTPGKRNMASSVINSPAQIRSWLASGIYREVGHQVVDGVNTIKLIEDPVGSLTLWVSPVTYLPVRMVSGPVQTDYQWLTPTKAHLALLDEPIPDGFTRLSSPPR